MTGELQIMFQHESRSLTLNFVYLSKEQRQTLIASFQFFYNCPNFIIEIKPKDHVDNTASTGGIVADNGRPEQNIY